MPFVKIDCGILNSSLWIDRPAREIFITALLLAEPAVYDSPLPQIKVGGFELTGWCAPPGWYGFVPAAAPGIISRTGLNREEGMEALKRLGEPDDSSRSPEYEGRRLIRIQGGFIVLNYEKYRERDYTNSERQKRWREKRRNTVTLRSNAVTSRYITQAEAEAEVHKNNKRVWAKPTIEQVRLLMAKSGGPESEALKFFNFYESKNWFIGKNRMTSVGHAVGGWVARWKERNLNGNTSYQRNCAENPRNAGTCESTTDFEAVVRRKQEAQMAGQMALLNVAPQSTTETT